MSLPVAIAIASIWSAVAITAVYAGPIAAFVAFFAIIPTCVISVM